MIKEFSTKLEITSRETPTESYNPLPLGERYHSIIGRVYSELKIEKPHQNERTKLQHAVHAVKNTTGPLGPTTTLLVFRAVPIFPLSDKQHYL